MTFFERKILTSLNLPLAVSSSFVLNVKFSVKGPLRLSSKGFGLSQNSGEFEVNLKESPSRSHPLDDGQSRRAATTPGEPILGRANPWNGTWEQTPHQVKDHGLINLGLMFC